MKTHFDLSDKEFKTQFSNCTLNPTLFNHEAHLRLAWLFINEFGLDVAEIEIKKQLQNFVGNIGANDKFHLTITIVAMKIMNNFLKQSKTRNFKDFIIENPKLKSSFKELIGSHYSYNVFDSEKAKNEFIKPDLLPFDK